MFHVDGLSDLDIKTGIVSVLPNKNRFTNKYIQCYKKANFDRINLELLAFANEFLDVYLGRPVEENCMWLQNTLISLSDMHISLAKITCFNSTPWLTIGIDASTIGKKKTAV